MEGAKFSWEEEGTNLRWGKGRYKFKVKRRGLPIPPALAKKNTEKILWSFDPSSGLIKVSFTKIRASRLSQAILEKAWPICLSNDMPRFQWKATFSTTNFHHGRPIFQCERRVSIFAKVDYQVSLIADMF